jgi:hypothetical protein
MLNAVKRSLSFANVVAILALFLALGGTVYAAGKLNGKAIKRNSVPGNRMKSDSITGLQVNESSLGTVPSATNAANATNATNAANAQPIAFAHVSGAGVLDAANSKNVGSVFRQSEGIYCFSGLPFTPRGGQATVDAVGSSNDFAQLGVGGAGCPNTEAFVDTFDSDSGTSNDDGFYVVFYG